MNRGVNATNTGRRSARVAAAALSVAAALFPAAAIPQAQTSARDGVAVDEPSRLRRLVPASRLEQAAAQQYEQMKREAAAKRALAPDNHPQVLRLRAIASRIIAHAGRWNPDAAKWKWEVNLIGSKQINAFCMPGGKIAFYTGILEQLKLGDDEVAVIMGHEVAHALREHARERVAKTELTRLGATIAGALIGNQIAAEALNLGGSLLTLKFSRDDEIEADVVGLDLAARAGFDPRAGITLWQKMTSAGGGAPPAWLSTHPSGPQRIREIENQLPKVLPLYEQARRERR